MKDALERIKKLVEELKEQFGDRLEFSECELEDNVRIEAALDGKEFSILYIDDEYLRVFIPQKCFKELEEELTPIIKKSLHRPQHVAYNQNQKIRVLEWDTQKSFEKRKKEILNNGPTDHVTFYWGNNGTIKSSPSMLAFRHDLIFRPVPKEQRLTEETLILLERRIAKAAAKNEQMLIMSEYYAAHPYEASERRKNEELREQVDKLTKEVEELKENKEEKVNTKKK